eukprot:Blabericola_migrator_1__12251@NODE_763_length_6617_cov_151_900153_g476_i2_p4_GENE_NODE_763_length_6617_cov_151_900153_g476_i2NODE_763_length_6617_cov_151_900153_g476_i2_p4_ORF_typecomplete_len130_score27_52NAD2/PF18782_1/0_011FGase/PF05013_12/0_014zfC3HC4/PF00097_25/0_15zfRING_2/PF13639_6/0_067zfRING_5/PF14634_6/0_35VPS28/PF03997_12/0_23_NODE_763_length_6617_cov_151_900153_g476_i227183107
MECKICMEDLDASNELEFTTDTQVTDSTLWHPCLFCLDCVQTLINTQYHKFRKDIVDLDCERAIKRLVKRGPPVYIHDVHGFPEAGEEEVPHMRLKATKAMISGKLDGAKEGEERLQEWNELKAFIPDA